MPKGKKFTHKKVGRGTPFKKAEYLGKKKGKVEKSYKHIIQGENFDLYPVSVPNYLSIEAAPSIVPCKKFSDISGYLAKYTDPKTNLRFSNSKEFKLIHLLSQEHIDSYLSLRRAAYSIR